MKLTHIVLFFTLIIMICGAPVVAQRTAPPSAAVRSPEVVLKEFYTWYIHADFLDINPFKGKARVTFKKYVTARFVREIDKNDKLEPGEAFDADYFLQTQDPLPYKDSDVKEAEWLKSMSVTKVVVRGSTATAIVIFLDGYPKVKVTLIKEGGVWKINNVRNLGD